MMAGMALLLEQIEWEEPVLPLGPRDDAWEAKVAEVTGMGCPDLYRRIAPSAFLREICLDSGRVPITHVSQRHAALVHLVVSQESSCRYCYGTARALLQLFGFDKHFIDEIERDAQLAESDPAERAFLSFCRRLARSNPRPARRDREQLVADGYKAEAVAETAFLVGACVLGNRLATLQAAPPAVELERLHTGFWRLMRPYYRWRMSRGRMLDFPDPPKDGPFEQVIAELRGVQAAGALHKWLTVAFESHVLPVRTTAFLFAVVARSLGCKVCEPGARTVLAKEGVASETVDEVLATLASRTLDPVETRLVPWVRDTVRYQQPSEIQRKTRALLDAVGVDVTLEAIGIAALANATVRIAMLAQ
jgi:alkylhydroperoxidase family enzyme